MARPLALSGFAGTMMSQLTFAAAAVAAGVVLLAAEGLADAPSAAGSIVVELVPRTTMTIAISSPSATGMARMAAIRVPRFQFARRRRADLRPVTIQFTSIVRFESSRAETLERAAGGEARV